MLALLKSDGLLGQKPKKGIVQRWIDRRTPRQDDFCLGLGNIYVFFSRQGLLFLLLLLITFITGVNYGNNLVLGLFFYLLSIWFVSTVVTYLQLSKLQIALKDISLGQDKGLLWVTIAIKNHQGKAVRQLHLSFDDLSPTALLNQTDIQQYQHNKLAIVASVSDEVLVRLPVIASHRGIINLPRFKIKSSYPLGVVQAWSYGFFKTTALAYPAPKVFDYNANAYTISSELDRGNFYQKGQDDFDGLDSYKEGESLSKVSWTHLARGMGMLTKQFTDPVGQENILDYTNMPSTHHEDKLSELSYLVQNQGNRPFVLVLPSGVGEIGMGDEFIKSCLIRLAKEP